MAHNHPVTDKDTHFKIDSATRLVKNVLDTKTMLVQYDHKSERFTFEVDRKPDEHDLSLCNRVRVHYINIEKSKRTENKGVCPITDTLQIHPDDDNLVMCSWLVPKEATQLVGSLHFVIEFACIEGNELLYSWNTARHTAVTIAEGIDGGEDVINANLDILTQWENELKANQIIKMEQTTTSTEDNGVNVWTATFGDGRTQELAVRNGSKGNTGLIGSIETVQGHPLHFFVGTQAEYEKLPDENKTNLFAIITDDKKPAEIAEALEAWNELKAEIDAFKNNKKYLHQISIVGSSYILFFSFVSPKDYPLTGSIMDLVGGIYSGVQNTMISASGQDIYQATNNYVYAVQENGVSGNLKVYTVQSIGYFTENLFNTHTITDTVIELH